MPVDTTQFLRDMADLLRQCDTVRKHLSECGKLELSGTDWHNVVTLDETLNKLSSFLRNHGINLVAGIHAAKNEATASSDGNEPGGA